MHDIFLSYSTVDRERLVPLVAALEQQGWSVFWDHRSVPIGGKWREVIEEAVCQCRCVLVVWSQASVKSKWVKEEASEGSRRGVLLPIRVDDVLPPFGFREDHAGDFLGWDGTTDYPEFIRLEDRIRLLLEEQAKYEVAERERLVQEKIAAEQQAREAAEQQRRLEEEEAAERERLAKEEAAEQERLAQEKIAAEQQARDAAEQQRRLEEEVRLRSEAAKAAERERLAKEKALAEHEAAEHQRRLEEETRLRCEAEAAEQERLAQEKAAAEQQVREQAEHQRRLEEEAAEQERLAREKALAEHEAAERKREKEARLHREAEETAERERLAKEKALAEHEAASHQRWLDEAQERLVAEEAAKQKKLEQESAAEQKARQNKDEPVKPKSPFKVFLLIPALFLSAAVSGGIYSWGFISKLGDGKETSTAIVLPVQQAAAHQPEVVEIAPIPAPPPEPTPAEKVKQAEILLDGNDKAQWAEAIKQLKILAEADNAEASYILGGLYYLGRKGVKRSTKEGCKFYKQADAHGHSQAGKTYADLKCK